MIGTAIASAFAAAGAELLLTDLNRSSLETTATIVRKLGRPATILTADLADDEELAELIRHVLEPSHCTILVNNAACLSADKPFLDTTDDDWDTAFAVNVRAVGILSREAIRAWTTSGRPGRIVNISSVGAQRAHRATVIYDATKGAIDALTRALAVEFGPDGIRVNAVAPAAVQRGVHVGRERRRTSPRPFSTSHPTPHPLSPATSLQSTADCSHSFEALESGCTR